MDTNIEIDLHRLDDDGAPHHQHIGIAPPLTLVTGPESPPKDTVRLGGGGGLILPAGVEAPPQITWQRYAAWRKTKCPERDLAVESQRLKDLDQATHELVGEVAEIGELFIDHGPAAFYGENRTKLIDECGDVFFCSMWALDAWGINPLADTLDELELIRVTEDEPILEFTRALASRPAEEVMSNGAFISMLGGLLFQLMMHAQTFTGLTSNSCKKQVYQGREQDAAKQAGRILTSLLAVNQILILANSSVEEALTSNMRKLDARYPTGWTGGGGIRTGEGK